MSTTTPPLTPTSSLRCISISSPPKTQLSPFPSASSRLHYVPRFSSWCLTPLWPRTCSVRPSKNTLRVLDSHHQGVSRLLLLPISKGRRSFIHVSRLFPSLAAAAKKNTPGGSPFGHPFSWGRDNNGREGVSGFYLVEQKQYKCSGLLFL